jgi:putative solute:sodium symporter small subunit
MNRRNDMPDSTDAAGSKGTSTDAAGSKAASTDVPGSKAAAALRRYWRANIRIMAVLLGLWALAGLGAGVLFADTLNAYRISGTGFPLGFWFAHQGSIIVFVLLILAYCLYMNHLDNRHRRELETTRQEG